MKIKKKQKKQKKTLKAFLIDIFVFYIVLYKQIIVVNKHTACLNQLIIKKTQTSLFIA